MSSSYAADFQDPTPKNFEEVKATQAALLSSAFFINEYCKDYNDDFMLCKRENGDPAHCHLEGRKVTRCVLDLLNKLETNCQESFTKHWKCLSQNNNYYWKCREEEQTFNQCVFKHLGLKKTIPDAPDYEVPIHMRPATERWYK